MEIAWQVCLGIFLFCTIFRWLTNVIMPATSKTFEEMFERKNMNKAEKEKMFKMWKDYKRYKKDDYIDFWDMLEKEDIKLYNLACNKYDYRKEKIEYRDKTYPKKQLIKSGGTKGGVKWDGVKEVEIRDD